jgi:hypothetical protein
VLAPIIDGEIEFDEQVEKSKIQVLMTKQIVFGTPLLCLCLGFPVMRGLVFGSRTATNHSVKALLSTDCYHSPQ